MLTSTQQSSAVAYKEYLKSDVNSVFNVNTIDEGVIFKIISNLNNKSSFGHDGISINL